MTENGARDRGAVRSVAAAKRVAELLAPLRHPEELVEILLREGAAHLGANTASLCLLVDDRTSFELVGAVGYHDSITTAWSRFPADAPVPARDAVERGDSVFLGSLGARDDRYPIFRGVPTTDKAYAIIPVGDDPAVGALTLGWPVERSFNDEDEVALLALLGALAGQALERARLFASSSRAQHQLALLAEVSRRLSSSLDVEATLASLLDAVVPSVAEGASVHLFDDGGIVQAAARGHTGGVSATDEVLVRARDGEITVLGEITPEKGDVISTAVLPLSAREGPVGALTLTMSATSGRRFSEHDTPFLADLAGRAGTAISHAIAHRARIEIAETLQQSLLPPSLPALPGLEVASIYRPMPGGRVGGDFFDVFPLGADGERFGILIGDVSGKGVNAAALTARIRYTVRALAPRLTAPADVIAQCNAAVHDAALPERFATLVFAVVDTTRRPVVIDLVVAGHPEPVVWGPEGLRLVTPTGPVVGLFPDGEWRDERIVLSAGHTLVLFTDGLTEARAPGGAFFPTLVESALSTARPDSAQSVVSTLVSAMDEVAGDARDDLAILALSPS